MQRRTLVTATAFAATALAAIASANARYSPHPVACLLADGRLIGSWGPPCPSQHEEGPDQGLILRLGFELVAQPAHRTTRSSVSHGDPPWRPQGGQSVHE